MNNPYSFTLPRNNDSPLSLEGKTKITTVLHHTRVFPCVIHPRLTVPGQLRNARKAYGPGMVHARSLQLLSPAAHLDLHFSLSSALSLVTPMTGRSEDPPAREKNTHAVFEKLRATRRAACVLATHLFPSLLASDVTRGAPLDLEGERNSRDEGRELFESFAFFTRWRDVERWNVDTNSRLERVPTTTTGASRRIKGRIGGHRVAMRRAAKPAPAGYHQIDRNKLTLVRLPPPPL